MPTPRRLLRSAGIAGSAAILALGPVSARTAPDDPLGTRGNPVAVDIPDSLLDPSGAAQEAGTPAFRVRGARVRAAESASAWKVTASSIESSDSGSLDDVVRRLPAVRPAVNSRGEVVFSIRGAPERHVQVTLDDIPLTVPWDERADLSMIPTNALGGVSVDRGVTTALAIPGGLAGVVELRSRDVEEGRRTRLGAQIGEVEAWQVRGLHAARQGNWSYLAAASHRTREGFLLSEGRELEFNQFDRQTRQNSYLTQTSALGRLTRHLGNGGEVRLLVHAADGERGVPPESHIDDPRLWQVPTLRRVLVGVSGEVHPAEGWTVNGVLALDRFEQEIREFDDLSYTTPALAEGVELEDSQDVTVTARGRVTRATGMGRISVQGHLRSTTHDEVLAVGDPEQTYSQRITALAAEWSHRPGEGWLVRAGGGIEAASTPDTGAQPAQDSRTAPVLSAGLTRILGWGQVEARASRKSRFPSLRELYSGALGRFVPNPDLEPEEQTLVELSGLRRTDRTEVSAGVFFADATGLIEREVVDADAGQFQRVNRDDARTLGFEASLSARPVAGMTVELHHTILDVRADDQPVEDRPQTLTQAVVSHRFASGVQLTAEAIVTGARESGDVRAPDGLTRIPTQARLNLRAAYRWYSPWAHFSHLETFVRLDNATDGELDAQIGLPEAGRTVTAGVRVLLD